jgi:hypothetical protein
LGGDYRDEEEGIMPEITGKINQEFILALIKGLDEKFGLLIDAQKDGVKIAMDASEKAVAKAETAAERRFEALNELRAMAADWRSEFARQSTVNLQIEGINEKLAIMSLQLQDMQSRSGGRKDFWVWVTGGVIAGATLFSAISSHFGH